MTPVAPEGCGTQAAEEEEDDRSDDDADDGDGRVLTAKVGAGAFLDRGRDLDHALVAGRHAKHLAAGDDPVEHGKNAANYGTINQVHGLKFPRS